MLFNLFNRKIKPVCAATTAPIAAPKITQEEADELFIRILTQHTLPACVGAAAPMFVNKFDRLDADFYKKYQLICSDWSIRRHSSLYIGSDIEDSVLPALSKVFRAHTKIVDFLCGAMANPRVEPEETHTETVTVTLPKRPRRIFTSKSKETTVLPEKPKSALGVAVMEYQSVLRQYGLSDNKFYVDFLSDVAAIFCFCGYEKLYAEAIAAFQCGCCDEDLENDEQSKFGVSPRKENSSKSDIEAIKRKIGVYEARYYERQMEKTAQMEGLMHLVQSSEHRHPARIGMLTHRLFKRALDGRKLKSYITNVSAEVNFTGFGNVIDTVRVVEQPSLRIGDTWIERYLFGDFVNEADRTKVINYMRSRPMVGDATLDLSSDIVLAAPPDATCTGTFNRANNYYAAVLYLPVGIAIAGAECCNTPANNNSRTPSQTLCRVYDLSELYSEIYFDGEVWRAIEDKRFVAEAGVWELCAIFELYRPHCTLFDNERLKLENKLEFKGAEFSLASGLESVNLSETAAKSRALSSGASLTNVELERLIKKAESDRERLAAQLRGFGIEPVKV